MGGDDLGDDLVRFESLCERARGLAAAARRAPPWRRARPRRRRSTRASSPSLEAEAARLAGELVDVEAEAAALRPAGRGAGRGRGGAGRRARAASRRDWAEGVAAPERRTPPRSAASWPPCAAASSGARARPTACAARLDALAEQDRRASPSEAERLRGELAAAEQAELPLVEALDGAEQRRAEAEAAVADRRGRARARAEREHARLGGPGRGPRPRPRRGPRPAPAPSAWPASTACSAPLLDLVEIDAGWEAAFEAAAGEALAAVVVDGVDAGRRALAALHGEATQRAPSSPSAPPAASARRRRWASRCAATSGRRGPRSSRCSTRWSAPPSWSTAAGSTAVDVALAHPEAVVVTADGDRFGLSGWRVGAAGLGCHRRRPRRGRAPGRRRRRGRRAGRRPPRRPPAPSSVEARAAEAELVQAARRQRRPAHRRRRPPPAGRDRPPRRRHRGRGAPEPPRRARPSGSPASDERIAELEAQLPALEAAETDAAPSRAARMAEARARLEEQAADGRRPAQRPRGPHRRRSTERRQFLDQPPGRGRERLGAHAAEREPRPRPAASSSTAGPAATRPPRPRSSADRSAVVEEQLGDLRERRRRSPRPPAPSPPSSTSSAHGRADGRDGARRAARAAPAGRDRAGRDPSCASRPRSRRSAATSTSSPTSPWPPSARELPEGVDPGRPGPRARARAADHGPDQPAGPRGVRGAPGAPRVPPAAARRREGDPPRAGQGHPGHRRRDRQRLRRRLRRRGRQLRGTSSRRSSPAARAGSSSPTPTTCSSTGIEVEAKPSGKNVQQALAALRWRALAHRAGLPVRRVPQPARRPST